MLKIGSLQLDSKAIAAPLAGYTDRAWRVLAREAGAGLVFSEMVSVEGLWRGGKTLRYLKNDERARPFGLQLFGLNPESFERALAVIANEANESIDLIDINMGCPVKKVVKKGAGSALMKTPDLAGKIIESVRKIYDGPLTVKIRSGWRAETINAVQIAKIVEAAGADAVIVHPRTQDQFFKGEADWDIIRDVKDNIKVPVIGNGDVVDHESFNKMLISTGCDGVMIGREAINNPMIFRDINGGVSVGRKEVFELIRRHLALLSEFEDERYTFQQFRKSIAKYLKRMEGSKRLFKDIYDAKDLRTVLSHLKSYETASCSSF
jgi:nifR3 family TIM-barrel protein